jgi:hypothetical protein
MPATTRYHSPDTTPARIPMETLPDSSDDTDGIPNSHNTPPSEDALLYDTDQAHEGVRRDKIKTGWRGDNRAFRVT